MEKKVSSSVDMKIMEIGVLLWIRKTFGNHFDSIQDGFAA